MFVRFCILHELYYVCFYTYSGCPTDVDIWNIEWQSTDAGNTSSQSCPGSQGIATNCIIKWLAHC